MSASIVDNLQAYKVELEELQDECRAKNGDGSPCVEMSLEALQRAIDNAVALLATVEQVLPLVRQHMPVAAEALAAQLQAAQSEVAA